MNKNVVIGIIIVLLIAGGLYFANTKQNQDQVTTPTTEGKTLTVGAVLSLTGFGAQDSASIKSGLELAKADLIAKGMNVTIDYQDDKTEPKQTVLAFEYFKVKKPDVIIGPIWSYIVDAAIPSIESSKIITYSPSVTSEYLQGSTTYLFQGAAKNMQAVPVIVKELTSRNVKNVAIINTNGAWGISMGQVFDTAVEEASANIALNEIIPFGSETGSMPTLMTKIKASGADAILWTGSKEGALSLVKRLQELSMTIPVIGTSGLRDIVQENLIDLGTLPVIVFTPTVSPDFVQKYEAVYGKKPNAYADTAYDGLMLLAEAKANVKDATEMKSYLENISYKGFSGTYTFDDKHDTNGGTWTAELITK